jgi:hypothetical protein
MTAYRLTIILSAVQLFLIQPIMARFILPTWGSPSVRTTCYLLSFSLCFDRQGRYDRRVWGPVAAGSLVLALAGQSRAACNLLVRCSATGSEGRSGSRCAVRANSLPASIS